MSEKLREIANRATALGATRISLTVTEPFLDYIDAFTPARALAALDVVEAARAVDIQNGPLPTDEECPALLLDPEDLAPSRALRAALAKWDAR